MLLVAAASVGALASPVYAQQAVLYELTENAGVSADGGVYSRHAYAALQGWRSWARLCAQVRCS
jgi:hypothetical protein